MIKSKLRSLRTLNATKAIMREGKIIKKEHGWSHSKYFVLCRAQCLDGLIKMALFEPEWIKAGIESPKYEVFINVKGEEWITRELDRSGKEFAWHSAMIRSLYGWYFCRDAYLTQDTKETLNRTFKDFDGDPLRKLENWQQSIRDKERERKEALETAPWDEDMKLIPKLPQSFEGWMQKECCKDFYIFYKYEKSGAKTGFCSRCHKTVSIKEPKHGKETKCPHCGAKATFKVLGKIQTLSTGTYYGQIIQNIEGGIVIREFMQRQHHFDGKGKVNRFTLETTRTLIFPDHMKMYEWGTYKNKCVRWIEIGSSNSYWRGSSKLYKRNWKSIRGNEIFKQSAIELWDVLPVSVSKYLTFEKEYPVIEKLAKVGMFRLASRFFEYLYDRDTLIDAKETELPKILKIDASRLKRLRAMDGDIKHLKWMQLEKIADTVWPDEVIKGLAEAGINSNDFGFLNPPISYVRAYNYLIKQAEKSGDTVYQTLQTWRDYHNMADQLKMDTKLDYISRPKDLTAAHNELVLIKSAGSIKKTAAELRKKWPKAEEHLKNLEKFEYAKGDYQIIAPKSLDDIVKEGIVLRHCVHTCDYYFARIQTDESYLFFLRKTAYPDMPWYTLEVEPSGNIRQKRTTGDNQNEDFEAAVGFLKDWQKYFKKQLTKKEKKLGEKANVLRKKNYADLRKNQNRIWHGKLAGQLLADVLEADLMLAE